MKTWMLVLTTIVLFALVGTFYVGTHLRSRTADTSSRCDRLELSVNRTAERFMSLSAGVERSEARLREVSESTGELSAALARQTTLLNLAAERSRALEQDLVRLRDQLADVGQQVERGQAASAARLERVEESLGIGSLVAGTVTQPLNLLPAGVILPWLPRGRPVPAGWALCDGSQGTPDLRGLFLRGAASPSLAGRYDAGARMQPAGVHTHTTDRDLSLYSLSGTARRAEGDGLLLFDTGYPGDAEKHGSHVHEDEHIPAHFTVAYIMKVGS